MFAPGPMHGEPFDNPLGVRALAVLGPTRDVAIVAILGLLIVCIVSLTACGPW